MKRKRINFSLKLRNFLVLHTFSEVKSEWKYGFPIQCINNFSRDTTFPFKHNWFFFSIKLIPFFIDSDIKYNVCSIKYINTSILIQLFPLSFAIDIHNSCDAKNVSFSCQSPMSIDIWTLIFINHNASVLWFSRPRDVGKQC